MDEYEQIYKDEFQHSILDSGEKVTITHLSDKYERSIREISEALSKWVISQDNKKFQKEYILKGTHQKGYPLITIVHEDKLEKAKASVTNPLYFIYSVELSGSSQSLDLPKLSKLKVKNILLPADSLKVVNSDTKPPVEVKESPTSVSKQHEIKPAKKPENYFKQKTVEPSGSKNDTQNDSKNDVVLDKSIKAQSTPLESKAKDKSNKFNSGPSKGNKGSIENFMLNAKPKSSVKSETKNTGKAKGDLITTHFNAKTNGVKSGSETNDTNDRDKVSEISKHEIKVEVVKVEEEISESEIKEEKQKKPKKLTDDIVEEKQTRKRSLDDSETKQGKAAKKFKAASTGRRRIVVDVDSSDEENVDIADDTLDDVTEVPPPKKSVVQKIEIKHQNEIDEENKVEETKPLEPITYQDDDGFLITIKDNKKPKGIPKKVKAPSPVKKTLQKLDKIPVRAAKKQGQITNFFSKK